MHIEKQLSAFFNHAKIPKLFNKETLNNSTEELMRNIFLIITLLSIALLLMLSASCTTQGPAEGSLENPLITDDYDEIGLSYSGTIGNEKLYIKVINISYFNNNHTVDLTDLTDDVDLYTYSDAIITQQESSTNSGTTAESCYDTTTSTGELYIMLDGTKTISGSNFTLTAGT